MAEAMLHMGGAKHGRGSGYGSFDVSITNSNNHPSKRGRSGSISGRLRTASDLEDMGLIDKAQKGLIKDLIISGDPALRTALDKYETGDAQALEGLIKGGVLARRQSVDLLNGLDLDFLTVQPNGESASSFDPSAFPYEDDFFMFPETDFNSLAAGHGNGHGNGNNCDMDSRSNVRRTSSLLGTFDLNGLADGGTFGSIFSMPRRHSLSLPGEVDLSAYENLAASLQQKKTGRQPKQPKMQKLPKPPKQTTGRIPKGGRAPKNSDSEGYAMGMGGALPKQTQYPAQKQTTVNKGMKADGGRGVPAPTFMPGMISSLYNADGTVREIENIPGRGEVGYIGAYSVAERRERIARFLAKRDRRVWTKKVKYDVRKNFADSRVRVKGRFVKKEDEELMKELLSIEP
jgi:hypothetical protein